MLTRRTHSFRRSGFTLIELLTVVSIIALLISILLPSLAKARDQAKRTGISAQLEAISKGLEMFNSDFNGYPDSTVGLDPVDDLRSAVPRLSGAHWLARALAGHDLKGVDSKGYVNRRGNLGLNPALTKASLAPPGGRYADRKGVYMEGEIYAQDSDLSKFRYPLGSATDSRIVVYENYYRSPVLYYKANPLKSIPFANRGNPTGTNYAIYTIEDNEDITGNDNPSVTGWDFSGNAGTVSSGPIHKLGKLGATGGTTANPSMTLTASVTESFARFLHSESSLSTVNDLRPVHPEKFVLITAGKDGIFGTSDDVANFKSGL